MTAAGQTSPLDRPQLFGGFSKMTSAPVPRLPDALIELALAGAEDATLAAEGFTEWEVRAARAIVRRATEHSSSPAGHSPDARARALTAGGT